MCFQLHIQPIQLIVQSTSVPLCPTLPKEVSILLLKKKIGIPRSQQLLMWQQKKINSNMLLVEQNITTGSIILVQTGIKGGSGKCQWWYIMFPFDKYKVIIIGHLKHDVFCIFDFTNCIKLLLRVVAKCFYSVFHHHLLKGQPAQQENPQWPYS